MAEFVGKALAVDMMTLKHQWLHSSALDGAVIVMDESHNAAGDTSSVMSILRTRCSSVASWILAIASMFGVKPDSFVRGAFAG